MNAQSVVDRITEYLAIGGYFNPELMEHDKVRALLIDAREALIGSGDQPLSGASKHSAQERSAIEQGIKSNPYPESAPVVDAHVQGQEAARLNEQDSLVHPAQQVYFRAGLIACREYMARFVEAQSPSIAMSIRANWWPSLGPDFGAPRKLDFAEVTSGTFGTPDFRIKNADEVSPTQEALPIALGFLSQIGSVTDSESEASGVYAQERSAQEEISNSCDCLYGPNQGTIACECVYARRRGEEDR